MILYIVITVSLVAIYLYRNLSKRKVVTSKWKRIPTESGLPILGVVTRMEKPLCNYLVKLSEKHGPIYQIKYGLRNIVVLNTFDYIKAALVDNGDAFIGRWTAQNYVFGGNDSGLLFSDVDVWTTQKSFVLKTLRHYGVGRSRSMEIIGEECRYLLEELEQLKGQSFDLTGFLSFYTINVILKFIMNKRFSRGDPELAKISTYMAMVETRDDPVSNFALMFPILDRLEWLMKFIIWITSRKSLVEGCHVLFEKEIKEHSSKLDLSSDGDDLIDRFLIKQGHMRQKNRDMGTFTDLQLVRNGFELVFAGYDTTATTLVWSFMFMAMYPEIQTKVHEEIIETIGSERMPTMGDKVSFNYTLAVMDEIYRLSNMAPLSLMHRTLTDVTVKGYLIPKNTIIIPNLLACHVDPEIWTKPLEFYPEHFLFTDDHGKMKYKPRDELIPFSLGKRNCLGEPLARMEIYVFFLCLMQKFHVRMVNEIPHFDVFSANEGIIRTPKVGQFVFERRN